MSKKIITILHAKILLNWAYVKSATALKLGKLTEIIKGLPDKLLKEFHKILPELWPMFPKNITTLLDKHMVWCTVFHKINAISSCWFLSTWHIFFV